MSNLNVNNLEHVGGEINGYVNYVNGYVNQEQVLLSQEMVTVDHVDVDVNEVNADVNNVNENMNVNNAEQVLLSQEVLPVNVDHVDVDVNAEAMNVNNVNNLEQVFLVNMEKVKVGMLAVLAMLAVIRDDDIVDTPRLKEITKKRVRMGRKSRK
jgi:hypothetical protein